jgi:predicted phosphodiesterase
VTRWGVLADIHGNLPALEWALSGFSKRGVERIAVLGDNLGRGDSVGCVARLREVAEVSVVGNRDLDWRDRVDGAARDYVLALPRTAIVDGVAFSHGDARLNLELCSAEIRTDFKRATAWLLAHGCRAWLFGHTHRARAWSIDGPGVAPRLLFDAATGQLPARIDLPPGGGSDDGIWIFNAGSVGLPFTGKGPPSAAVFDATLGVVELFPLTP